jgi:hypothetical protein
VYISAEVNGLCVNSLRATAATDELPHEADSTKVQEWLPANVSTTLPGDRRKMRPEDSPTFRDQLLERMVALPRRRLLASENVSFFGSTWRCFMRFIRERLSTRVNQLRH